MEHFLKKGTMGVKLLIVVVTLLSPAWCRASDGNKLLTDCGAAVSALDDQPVDRAKLQGMSFCIGLMQGMLHMNQLYQFVLKDAALFCHPTGVNNGQAARIVVKYLRDHPGELHKDDSALVFVALREAYPCSKTSK